jgi:hypothetical protein
LGHYFLEFIMASDLLEKCWHCFWYFLKIIIQMMKNESFQTFFRNQ